MSLQTLFNEVVLNEHAIQTQVPTRQAYDSLRVSLIRKFAAYKKQCQSIGIPSYDYKYVSASFDSVTGTAQFVLRWKDESSRCPRELLIFKV